MVATPGRRLGRYHLVEPIGAGPCGEVYRAKVVGVAGMERQLAVKRFYPAVLAMPEAGPRLQQASRSYGGLDHPRIARLSELGVAGGETFTATELVPGLDLGRLRAMMADAREPLPSGGVLALISAAARTIGYAHGRGVCHWGVSPGNLIVTPDGDVKVTDFCIITCRLPARPSTDPSLLQRLPYLAPEQMLGEPLAAATDVFALGILAYELISGARPFTGATAADIEQAIVSGRPAPLDLPRPIARVIDRCLARSPFERFPDARSLADALDAALRLAPLTGGSREIGDRVRGAMDQLARINEQQLSGALSFSVPTPPPPPLGRVIANPNLPLPPPLAAIPAAPAKPPALPAVPPRPFRVSAPPLSVPPTNPGDEITQARPGPGDLGIGDDTGARIVPMWPPTEPVQLVRPDGLPLTAPRPELPRGSSPFDRSPAPADSARGVTISSPPSFDARAIPVSAPPPFAPHRPAPPPPPIAGPPPRPMAMPMPRPRRGRGLAIAGLVVLLAGGAAAAGYVLTRPHTAPVAATDAVAVAQVAPRDAAAAPAAPRDAQVGAAVPHDAAVAVDAAVDAAVADPAAVDAGPVIAVPTVAADKLTITSTPTAARVFLDGADQGVTPLTLAGSGDDHALAVVMPGRALHLATIPGAGAYAAELGEVAPRAGRGGIKVRCKDKRRYYVFIDGVATGELCPTERIPVELGPHAVEIYDLVTETRRTLSVRVVKVARSTRVRID